MTNLDIYLGFPASYDLQCVNRKTQTPVTDLRGTDTLSGSVWAGQSETPVFTFTPTWYTAGNTQTGFDEGQITAPISAAQSAMLEANGGYLITCYAARSGITWPIWEGLLRCLPQPGTSTQQTLTYNSYSDMLGNASWVSQVQDEDVDQEGFYTQRLAARNWFDWMVINNYRNSYAGEFGMHSQAAFMFGYVGYTRSVGPNKVIIDALAANQLIVRPQVVECCTHYALAKVGLAQLSLNAGYFACGRFHADEARRLATGIVAEIDTNADGIGEYLIPLALPNTLNV